MASRSKKWWSEQKGRSKDCNAKGRLKVGISRREEGGEKPRAHGGCMHG
jgi:hypothetical protein